ncbi:PRC-barrel domain containing protein [Verrucomicrobiota bacterium sgz303538]
MLRPFNSLSDFKLAASDGEFGKLREVYFDDHSWMVRYLVVDTGGWWTGHDVLIAPRSLGEVNDHNRTLVVNLSQEQIRNSPPVSDDRPISRQFEEEYHAYYGWEPYWVIPGGATGLWPPSPEVTPAPEPSMSAREHEIPKGDSFLRSSNEVSGYTMHALDGHIGHLEDLVVDDEGWAIRYLIVDTRNWLPGKHVLISPEWIRDISGSQHEIFVNKPRSDVEYSLEYDPDVSSVSRALEGHLYDLVGYNAIWEGIHSARLRR